MQYLLNRILSGTRVCVGLSFVFHMAYLLLGMNFNIAYLTAFISTHCNNSGYYRTGTDTYDIKWSMPHCVLTLRLIGLSLDFYDGRKKPEQLNAHQKKMALVEAPTLLEMCGHVYFPGGFLVGPQFSMRRYLDMTSNVYDKVRTLKSIDERSYYCFAYRKRVILPSVLSPVFYEPVSVFSTWLCIR